MKIFCKKCGFCNNYNILPPDKCIKCDFQFDNNILINTAKNNNSQGTTPLIVVDKKERNDFKNIKPSFKVTVYQSKPNSLSSLIDQNKDKEPLQFLTPEEKLRDATSIQRTQEQVLEEFKQEGSSLR
jgi:hypothetical protein